jgi:hypothetical protein
MFHAKFVDTFLLYLYRKFHLPRASGSLVIVTKPKAKYRSRADAILFFTSYKSYFNQNYIFFKDLLKHMISVPTVRGADVDST